MALRCVIVLASFVFASGSYLDQKRSHGHMRHVKEDLIALERFANTHSLMTKPDDDRFANSHSSGKFNEYDKSSVDDDEEQLEKQDSDLMANVTFLANQQQQTAISATAIFVPHGKSVPQVPGQKYIVATGNMECLLCTRLIKNGFVFGFGFDLSSRKVAPEYKQMADAMTQVLQSCPEFTNGWCYQDLGGSQKLRGPCPDHLICHYCLGLNPLMCV